jgi:pilus assembly protein CpaC
VLLSGAWNNTVQAQGNRVSQQNYQQLPLNSSQLIDLTEDENRVSSANPAIIVAVLLPETHQLLIRAVGLGSTQIVFFNQNNLVSRTLTVEVVNNLNSLKQQLSQLLPAEENIKIFAAHGNIVLSGEVSNSVNKDAALKLAETFVKKRRRPSNQSQGRVINMLQSGSGQQVILEVKVAQVNSGLLHQLDIAPQLVKSSTSKAVWSLLTANIDSTHPYITQDTLLNWIINMGKNSGLASVLAEPNLTTLSGQLAYFSSSGAFPSQVCHQSSTNTAGCSPDFKPFGIKLEFLPLVLNSEKISLTTHISLSTLHKQTAIHSNSPDLFEHKAQSTLELTDGQTLLITDLLNKQASHHSAQMAQLPADSVAEKELVILVTAHLAKPSVKLSRDTFVEPDEMNFYLLGADAKKANPLLNAKDGFIGAFGHQLDED